VRVHELAREWVRAGHQVTVLTGFPHHPTGVVPVEYRGFARKFETLDGIRVIRTWLLAAPNVGVLRRSLCYTSFALSAMLSGALYIRRPDVVIATSPQLLVGAAGWFLARVKRCPFVFEVRDLWPDALIAVGMSKGGMPFRLLKRVESFLYHHAEAVAAVTRGFKKTISRQTDAAVWYVPNGVDLSLFRPLKAPARSSPRVGYLGTIGLAHGLDLLLRVASRLPKVEFHIWGAGADKERLTRAASAMKLGNLSFHPPIPRREMPSAYASLDVCVVMLRPHPLFTDFLPSKLLEALACGVPVVAVLEGEGATVAGEAGGTVVKPGDEDGLTRAIAAAVEERGLNRRRAMSGREYIKRCFDRKFWAERYLTFLDGLTARRWSCRAATRPAARKRSADRRPPSRWRRSAAASCEKRKHEKRFRRGAD